MQAKFKAKAEECGGKEGASGGDVEAVVKKQIPGSHEGKCIIACMFEGKGIMKDNKLDMGAFESMITAVLENDAGKIAIAKEIAGGCAGITDGDRCEAAAKIVDCMHQGAAAKGIEVGQ